MFQNGIYEKILERYGLKVNEEFLITDKKTGKSTPAVFKMIGLGYYLYNAYSNSKLTGRFLLMLIEETCTIRKLPWKPKLKQLVWFYDFGHIYSDDFNGSAEQLALYKAGWLFPREEDITEEVKQEINQVQNKL